MHFLLQYNVEWTSESIPSLCHIVIYKNRYKLNQVHEKSIYYFLVSFMYINLLFNFNFSNIVQALQALLHTFYR